MMSMPQLFTEVAVWTTLYVVLVVRILVPFIRAKLKRSANWGAMKQRKGHVLRCAAEEAVLSFALAAHHLVSGGIMVVGYLTGQPDLWTRGAMIEMAYEIVDTYSLLMNNWPYSEFSQQKVKLLTLIHHVPVVFLIPALFQRGYYAHLGLQQLGWSLIGAGGLTMLCEGFKKTRNLDTERGLWLGVHVFNMITIVFLRFIIFPQACYSVIRTLVQDRVPFAVIFFTASGMSLMTVFNCIVLAMFCQKLYFHGSLFINKLIPTLSSAVKPETKNTSIERTK